MKIPAKLIVKGFMLALMQQAQEECTKEQIMEEINTGILPYEYCSVINTVCGDTFEFNDGICTNVVFGGQ